MTNEDVLISPVIESKQQPAVPQPGSASASQESVLLDFGSGNGGGGSSSAAAAPVSSPASNLVSQSGGQEENDLFSDK